MTAQPLDTSVDELVREVVSRIPMPIDTLEVTALLESLGVTDELASRHYGAADAFDLGARVLAAARAVGGGAAGKRVDGSVPTRDAITDYLQGPLTFIPALALIVVIRMYGALGGWQPGQVLALGLGMTASMLACSGLVYGMSRRASICLAMKDRRGASYFLRLTMLVAAVCVTAIASVLVLLAGALGLLTSAQRVTFALAFLGLSSIWILASALSLLRGSGWLGVGLCGGVLVGVASDRALAPYSDLHLAAGTVAGFGTAIGVVSRALVRSLDDPATAQHASRVVLPSHAYLIYEAAPYFIYGALYALLPFLPHVIGWFGALKVGEERWWAVVNLEAGLTLSLPPLILAGGVAERTLRQFWDYALTLQNRTPGHAPHDFGRLLHEFYRWHLGRYLIVLGVVSVATLGLFRLALTSGLLALWVGYDKLDVVESLFLTSLLSYWFLGCGLFNCMFPISLARPGLAALAVAPALVVTVTVGVPLSLGMHFTYAAAALILGSLTYAAVSSQVTRRVLGSADYYYYSAY